jgi:sporulation related protein
VALRGSLGLAVIDRYAREEIDGIALPIAAATLRLDPLGRWLLARPSIGDTAWIVDLPIKRLAGALPTSWRLDLPVVTPNGSVLARQGADVVSVTPDSLAPQGRVTGGAADLWVVTSWRPRGGARYAAQAAPPPGAAAAPAAADSVGPEGPLYVQVSVSQNQEWSARLAQELGRAGLPAKVLPPATKDEGFRVVLGPYPTREVAEGIGRKLGRPYWIYQPQPQP